jgi:hypothetical protein
MRQLEVVGVGEGLMKMKDNQKGNIQLIAAIVIILGVLVGGYLVSQRTNYLPKAGYNSNNWGNSYSSKTQSPVTGQAIKNDDQLMQASQDLDNQNLDQLDKDLNQNTSDAAGL